MDTNNTFMETNNVFSSLISELTANRISQSSEEARSGRDRPNDIAQHIVDTQCIFVGQMNDQKASKNA